MQYNNNNNNYRYDTLWNEMIDSKMNKWID